MHQFINCSLNLHHTPSRRINHRSLVAVALTAASVFCLCSPSTSAPAKAPVGKQKQAWTQYCNDKYAYCVDYPSYLHGEGEPDAGDGQKFSSASNPLKIAVWGNFSNWQNGDEMTIAQQRDWDLKNKAADQTITYKTTGKNWYVISGTEKQNIFYQRTVKGRETFATVLITYPEAKKADYAAVITHIGSSLRTQD